jgi:hypothetical protein
MRPGPGGSSDGIGPVGHLLRLVHDLEDPLAGRSRALRLPDPHAEHAQRRNHHQHDDVNEKNALHVSVPSITIRPPTRITAARSSGRNESSGT